MNKKRYVQLDALRGLAAISVFLSHYIGFINIPEWLEFISKTPLHIFWDGGAAVAFFFVLSGFCLALPYIGGDECKEISYFRFLIRRIFRLYPAYWFALILCILCKQNYVCPYGGEISAWCTNFWSWDDLSTKTYLEIISLIAPNYSADLLDPPSWSLRVEMRMAFALPVVFWISRHSNKFLETFIILLCFCSTIYATKTDLYVYPVYGALFYFGVIIAKYRVRIMHYVNKMSLKWSVGMCALGIMLYEIKFLGINMVDYKYLYPIIEWISYIITGIGSSILIIVSFRKPVENVFSNKFGIFLGEISYSFYLVHFPIILFLLSSGLRGTELLIISFILSLITAKLCFELIEKPMIIMGRSLTK